MTNYARSAYGTSNPNAGYPANGDFAAWGGHSWPKGVPASLLGTTNYTSGTTGQTLRVTMRKELVPLWNLIFEIQDRKYHYPVWARKNNESWGPWGYSNRPIAGTQRASGHSGALSVDENAPFNPYSTTFQCDMPPAMVKDLESLGLYWGGRYVGQKYDSMHYGFCRKPNTVAAYIAKAKAILGVATKPPAKPPVAKPPVKAPYTPPPSTSWPLPTNHYFGLKSGPPQSHGGGVAKDVPWVKWIQTRMNELKYAGLRVDGNFGPTTKAAVTKWQRARYLKTTTRFGEVWRDDFAHLMKDR
jgi:hypothetical protein